MKKTIVDALANQWPAALFIVLAGIVLGILVGLKAPMSQTYLATSSLRIAKPVVTGVDMPCTAGSLAALAKGTDGLAGSGASANAVWADVAGTDVLQIHATAPTPLGAANTANLVASNLIELCRRVTLESYSAVNESLRRQRAVTEIELRALDTRLIPAADVTATRADLTKQRDALQAQLTTLTAQQSLESATAAAKSKVRDALAPAARAAIAANDAVYKALRSQLDQDTIALRAMGSHYKDAYPALRALTQRVNIETQNLQIYSNELATKPVDLDPTYRAAEAVADQAQAALDETRNQIAAVQATLVAVNAKLGCKTAPNAQLACTPVPSAVAKVDLAALGRQRAEALKGYQALSERLNTVLAEEAQVPATGPIASAAIAIDPVRIGLLFAALLGVLTLLVFALVALLVALLLNMDRRLLTVQSITKLYGKPVIATVSPRKHSA